MTAQWAPENERSRYVAVVTTGQYLGTALTLVCSPLVKVWWQGIFCAHQPLCHSFPLRSCVSYLADPALWCSADLFGGMGLCWVVLWWHQAASSPSVDRRIPPQELRYTHTSYP